VHKVSALLGALEQIATARGVTTAQLAIAWVLSRGRDIIPLIGTKRPG
jgi:aryl-alcohol dehydrogenase-like predicted oxidoreductase